MSRILRLAFVLLLMAVAGYPIAAQVATGTPPFGSFSGGPEVINLANLNSHITIPVFHKPGRGGMNFTFDLTYDTSVWYPVTSGSTKTWTPVGNWGWSSISQAVAGYLSFKETTTTKDNGLCTIYTFTNYAFHDVFGTAHPFIGTALLENWGGVDGQNINCFSSTINSTTSDGSGLKLSSNGLVGTVTFPNGTSERAPLSPNGIATVVDRNGNELSVTGGGGAYTFTDTLGTTALTTSGTPPASTTFTYTAPSGVPAAYTMSYVSYKVATNFAVSGINESVAAATNLVDKITLPDNSFYQFTYEPTPATPISGACTPNCVTGRLWKVTLPTGGQIIYTYSGGAGSNGSGIYSDGTAATLTRTTPDTGTNPWAYARTLVSGTLWQTVVTDPERDTLAPSGNDTVMQFQGIYETERQVYQGLHTSGTQLRQWTTCYNGNTSNCNNTAVTIPIIQRTVTDQYGSSGLQCKHNYVYNSGGGMTEQDDYDYGSGAPGPLLRKVLVTFASLNNITAFRQTITVCNGTGSSSSCNNTGTAVSQANYFYDETTPTPTSAVTQHVSVTGSRGNLTSINPVFGLTEHFTYYDTGSISTDKDANSATTTYIYSSNAASCQMAFPTSISEPLNMSRSVTWDTGCVGGVPATTTDENNKVTTYTWNDPHFWRPANVLFPDGGETDFIYNSQTSIATKTKMNSSQNITITQLFDGLGRNKQQQLNSDPEGVTYGDTAYDALGRVYSASNPYRSTSDPTYGLTTYGYDALSRAKTVTLQDGSVASASYTNNTITATDPAGITRTRTYDSLGRLTQVLEDPGSTPHLNFETDYGYDALGNLGCVGQKGNNSGTFSACSSIPASWRARIYTYDAMSRLTSETNPESGIVTYGYDASGHQGDLTSRIAPAPNQTGSSTVTTTYAYDLLHRLTQKSYSGGTTATPSSFFMYDTPSQWGLSISNVVGRLSEAWNNAGAGGALVATVFSYDSMGRVILGNQCDPSVCTPGVGAPFSYTYDLAGNMTSYTNGVGYILTQSIDTAGRPTGLTSGLVDSQHPATLATVDPSVGYYPAGAPRKILYGNGLTGTAAFNNALSPCRINLNSSTTALGTCTDAIPSGSVQDNNYGFNAGTSDNGNVVSWNATGQQAFNRTYTYDTLNRLAAMSDSNTGQQCRGLSWSYDAWGNRTAQTTTAGSCYQQPTTTFSTKNQLPAPYQYDAAGNVTYDGSHTYTYDAENRIVQVDGTVGTCSTAAGCYTYDANGRRVEKATNAGKLDYLYDLSGNAVAEWTTSTGYTGWTTEYIYFNGGLVAEYKNNTTYFAHSDHLGSARLVTALNQSIAQNLDYLPYGELNSTDSGITTHEFTGDEQDAETALAHTLFRQYSSSIGRWMTPDPAGLAAVNLANPQSWNRYGYVLDDPTDLADPLGLFVQVPAGCLVLYPGKGKPGVVVCPGDPGMPGEGGPPAPVLGGVGGGAGGGGKAAQVLACSLGFPLMMSSWLQGGGSRSIGLSGSATLGAPTGGGDFGGSYMFNADSWGNVSATTTTAYNPMGQGILFPSAGANVGVTVAASEGSTQQITGPSFGGWAAYNQYSVQAAQSANGGPLSGAVTVGPGVGLQVAGANLSNTTERRSTNCLGAAITLIQWVSKLW
jgi:RHS repeat-associated protein